MGNRPCHRIDRVRQFDVRTALRDTDQCLNRARAQAWLHCAKQATLLIGFHCINKFRTEEQMERISGGADLYPLPAQGRGSNDAAAALHPSQRAFGVLLNLDLAVREMEDQPENARCAKR